MDFYQLVPPALPQFAHSHNFFLSLMLRGAFVGQVTPFCGKKRQTLRNNAPAKTDVWSSLEKSLSYALTCRHIENVVFLMCCVELEHIRNGRPELP